jgi:uncharacterized membrane protein (UPF0127 family)
MKAMAMVSALVGVLLAVPLLVWLTLRNPDAATLQASCPDFQQAQLFIRDYPVSVGYARTPAEQVRGLSGCPHLPAGVGLLFPYDPPQQVVFWMKDMIIPIDIIWIADGHVVGVEHSVPPPAAGTPEEELARYATPQPISAVLEVAAGTAAEQGIGPGTLVTVGK